MFSFLGCLAALFFWDWLHDDKCDCKELSANGDEGD